MNPLTSALVQKHRGSFESRPLLLALLQFGASVEPAAPKSQRAERRVQQMRLLRQWEKIEKSVAEFLAARKTDMDMLKHLPDVDLDYVDGSWRMNCEPGALRHSIASFLRDCVNIPERAHPHNFGGMPTNDAPVPREMTLEKTLREILELARTALTR